MLHARKQIVGGRITISVPHKDSSNDLVVLSGNAVFDNTQRPLEPISNFFALMEDGREPGERG